MRSNFVQCLSPCGLHRMHYTEWGDPCNERLVICVHGLSRNCRDFDSLAMELSKTFRVVCPDIVGRGRSEWLRDKSHYNYPQYLSDLITLIARVTAPLTANATPAEDERHESTVSNIYWVGTSMGGLLGMLLAAMEDTPLKKLVINDVGPLIPGIALDRIGKYLGLDPRFDTFAELEAHVRKISAPFGPLSDRQWLHLVEHGAIRHHNGTWGMRYDPGISIPFRQAQGVDVDLWNHWDKIACPTLILRGSESDVLLPETVRQMRHRGPHAQCIEFPGIGHAPMLMAQDQIHAVTKFLLNE